MKVTNYTLRCNSKTSLRKPEKSQRRLRGDVFNTSHWRRLWDLQISPFWDVSETLHETSQRRIWDASMPAGCSLKAEAVHVIKFYISWSKQLKLFVDRWKSNQPHNQLKFRTEYGAWGLIVRCPFNILIETHPGTEIIFYYHLKMFELDHRR